MYAIFDRWPIPAAVIVLAGLFGGSAPSRGDVASLAVNPTSVYGTDPSTGTVTVTLAFGRTVTVDLTSSNPAVASVPASVNTRFGDDTVNFTVTTYPVAAPTNVTITATEGRTSRQAVLTVRPPLLTSITFSPPEVRGGLDVIATITTNKPASQNWLCSISGPLPPVYFSMGSIVDFPQGATSTLAEINTQAVLTPVDALITVRPPTGQTPSVSGTLHVVPTWAQTLTVAPASVTAGAAALGCVTLNGPANFGGESIMLESSDSAVASVPATVQIESGDDDGCFVVQSHETGVCGSATISATFGGRTVEAPLQVGPAERLTDNAANERWNSRHSNTVDGKVLWTDGNDVFFNDGVATQLVQARGKLEGVEDFFFGLGIGGAPGEVIGAWRRGTDFAWVWRSGHAPVLVSAVNPFDPQQPLNPEALAIADGHVFMALQAFFDASPVKHVFRVDPVTGVATNLTGDGAVPGASRISTSGGQAAWLFVDSANPKLQFYNGETVTDVDSGEINEVSVRLAGGRLVYQKTVEGVSHVFLYDDRSLTPAALFRISPDADVSHGHFAPVTDGCHVAWLYGDANQSALDVMLYGGLLMTDATNRVFTPLGNTEYPVQLHRGQMLWKDPSVDLRYAAAGVIDTLCPTPAATFNKPWLADGFVAGLGPELGSSQVDDEVFMYAGLEPNDADLPMPPILVRASLDNRSVVLEWDRILGATSYAIYVAAAPGITKDDFASLSEGRRVADLPFNAARICGLIDGETYYFAVTSAEAEDEGALSAEISAVPGESPPPEPADALGLLACVGGPVGSSPPACVPLASARADLDCDQHVTLRDFAAFSNLLIPE